MKYENLSILILLIFSMISNNAQEVFIQGGNGHLKPGIPKPPVAFEISSVVFDFS